MNDQSEPELEELMDRELRRLSGWKAPAALMPRVMAAIQARANLAWWQQPFWAWPRLVQVAFCVVLTGTTGVLVRLGWALGNILSGETWPRPVQHCFAFVGYVWEGLVTLMSTASLVIHSGLQPWLWGAVGIILVLYLCCLGAGTVFLRLAWKRI